MIPIRVIPCLLLRGLGLVKTVNFKGPKYLGDPRNVVKIFNEKEVDELILLDINATPEKQQPQFELIEEIVSEAFMPVAYGGGVRTIADAKRLASIGIEKIVLNTYAVENPTFVREAADVFGSSSVVVCIDVKRSFFGKNEVYVSGGRINSKLDPVTHAANMAELGAGEIVINSIDRDGTMMGYDIALIKAITQEVTVPVIACGGAGTVEHLGEAVRSAGASAVAAGSMFVFQGKHRAVLISFPEPSVLKKTFVE